MNELIAMKGESRVVMTLLGEGRAYTVLTYADGSFVLMRDNTILGVWEASERDGCLEALSKVSPKASDADELTVLLVNGFNKHAFGLPVETVGGASLN